MTLIAPEVIAAAQAAHKAFEARTAA